MITSQSLYDFSEQLEATVSDSSSELLAETMLRTATSRAYYAAYHSAIVVGNKCEHVGY